MVKIILASLITAGSLIFRCRCKSSDLSLPSIKYHDKGLEFGSSK